MNINLAEKDYLDLAGKYFYEEKFTESKQILLKAIKKYPDNQDLYFSLGLTYNQLNLQKKAVSAYKKSILINPLNEDAHQNLGGTYLKINHVDKAIDIFIKLLNINSKSQPALYNLGIAYESKGQFEKALECFDNLVSTNPEKAYRTVKQLPDEQEFAVILCYFGIAYEKLELYKEAETAFKKAFKINPDLADLTIPYYSLARKLCDWDTAAKLERKVNKLSKSGLTEFNRNIESPLSYISRSDNKKQSLQIARAWSKQITKDLKNKKVSFKFNIGKKRKSKITVGYLSCDIGEHPVASQIVDLFKYHDRKDFNIFTYSYGPNDKGILRRKISNYTDRFSDMYGIDGSLIAKKIYKDKVDILIDLVGYASYQKADIAAYKPAPIQINYLGFPGSTGAKYIDYIIADKVLIPQSEKKYFSEKIIFMPDCYQVCSRQRSSKKKYTRRELNLPDDVFVFCSFNRPEKISEKLFDSWLNILKELPKSVLWLYVNNKLARKNLINYAKVRGLDIKRLVFAEKMDFNNHLARIKHADLALDTSVYTGGATTANILWAGVPVITIYGNHYLSRMSSSMLKNIGMNKLVVNNISKYEQLAKELVIDKNKLRSTRKSLSLNRKSFPLFNSKLFTKNLETVYKIVWDRYLHGQKPADIII